jgi:protein-L-isoaspartate(D-aspartate) O-methyltransferase
MGLPTQRADMPSRSEHDPFAVRRAEMVEQQIRRRGIREAAVLGALEDVPRHAFVPEGLWFRAYDDVPLPIGGGQTISQPYIVAAMTAALCLRSSDRVLDIGTGCGYQAAVLSRMAALVYSVEVRQDLAAGAAERLTRLGYSNVHVHCGDGTLGLPECAPFDAILVAAAAPDVPQPLINQLAVGGRLIVPVGESDHQRLRLLTRKEQGVEMMALEPCQFVPLIGRYGWRETLP